MNVTTKYLKAQSVRQSSRGESPMHVDGAYDSVGGLLVEDGRPGWPPSPYTLCVQHVKG
jgi:hypothetical protein